MVLLPVADALARILDGAERCGVEMVPVNDAAGRVLAQDVAANLTQPPFHSAAMDGYAMRASDIGNVERFQIVGEAAAGRAFSGSIDAGQAARIFTGAPVPTGADCVAIQENAQRESNFIRLTHPPAAGANIRPRGGDFHTGDILLREGRQLTARDIMLAAAMNQHELPVARKPLVAILATGDELVPPGAHPRPDQIISSSPGALAAMIAQSGGEPRLLGIARDTMDDLAAHIDAARACDILITIGGASVGDHDLVQRALAGQGATVDFHKVAMRPGKPLMSARLGRTRVIGVPGNPVATLICARVFIQPLIHRMTGRTGASRGLTEAILDGPIAQNGDRTHYMRGVMSAELHAAAPRVRALDDQDSSLMAAFAAANCLIVREPHAPASPAGDVVHSLPLDF